MSEVDESIKTDTFVKDFRETTIANFCLIDTNEFDDCLNDAMSFAKEFREKTTITSKDFRKTKAKNQLINDAKMLFRDETTTTFDFENFDEIIVENVLKIDVLLINKRSKLIIIR